MKERGAITVWAVAVSRQSLCVSGPYIEKERERELYRCVVFKSALSRLLQVVGNRSANLWKRMHSKQLPGQRGSERFELRGGKEGFLRVVNQPYRRLKVDTFGAPSPKE